MSFVVIELQTYTDGTVGNIVTAFTDRGQAEQKYHTILAAAAVSGLPKHAAVLLSNDGHSLMYQCYRHEAETVEEPAEGGLEF